MFVENVSSSMCKMMKFKCFSIWGCHFIWNSHDRSSRHFPLSQATNLTVFQRVDLPPKCCGFCWPDVMDNVHNFGDDPNYI